MIIIVHYPFFMVCYKVICLISGYERWSELCYLFVTYFINMISQTRLISRMLLVVPSLAECNSVIQAPLSFDIICQTYPSSFLV